jgi:anti-sigma B factor antagonist
LPNAQFEASAGRDDEVVLRVSGEIDLAAAPLFRDRLGDIIKTTKHDVTVDLAGVTFIDSSGLAVLVHAHHQLRAVTRTLVITHPSLSVTRVLQITGLDALLTGRRP